MTDCYNLTLIIDTLGNLYNFDIEEAVTKLSELDLVSDSFIANKCNCVICLAGSEAGHIYKGLCKCKTSGFHLTCFYNMIERSHTTCKVCNTKFKDPLVKPEPSMAVIEYASRHHIDLDTVTGTGLRGRVILKDVKAVRRR